MPSQKLVRTLGLPTLKPTADRPFEAEGLCSALYSPLGLVDYVVSEDTDVAVYGAPLLRRVNMLRNPSAANLASSRDSREELTTQMNVLDPVEMRKCLELGHDEFVELALLCGTDFNERLPRCVVADLAIAEMSRLQTPARLTSRPPHGRPQSWPTQVAQDHPVRPTMLPMMAHAARWLTTLNPSVQPTRYHREVPRPLWHAQRPLRCRAVPP